MGARLCQPVDGCLIGDDPQSVAVIQVTVPGASVLTAGVFEGIAESMASLVKVFSDVLSDYLGKRKTLAMFGYAPGALTKPMFAIVSVVGMVLAARLIDRVAGGCAARHAMP